MFTEKIRTKRCPSPIGAPQFMTHNMLVAQCYREKALQLSLVIYCIYILISSPGFWKLFAEIVLQYIGSILLYTAVYRQYTTVYCSISAIYYCILQYIGSILLIILEKSAKICPLDGWAHIFRRINCTKKLQFRWLTTEFTLTT